VKAGVWAAGVAAWAAVGSWAFAQEGPKPAQIDRNGVLILIRETLIALDQANKTGNYTVLRDLGSPAFQANTSAKLAEIFAPERRDNLDLSGVAVLEPQLSLLPQIEANGLLHMTGFFPSAPQQVNFDVAFAPGQRSVEVVRNQRRARPYRAERPRTATSAGPETQSGRTGQDHAEEARSQRRAAQVAASRAATLTDAP